MLELIVGFYLFFCGCYDLAFVKNGYFIYLFIQSVAFFIAGFGYVGTFVPNSQPYTLFQEFIHQHPFYQGKMKLLFVFVRELQLFQIVYRSFFSDERWFKLSYFFVDSLGKFKDESAGPVSCIYTWHWNCLCTVK